MKNISRVLAVAAVLAGGVTAAQAAYTLSVIPVYTGYWDPTFTTFVPVASAQVGNTVNVVPGTNFVAGSIAEIDIQYAYLPNAGRTQDNLQGLSLAIQGGAVGNMVTVNSTSGSFSTSASGGTDLTAIANPNAGVFWEAFNPSTDWYGKNSAQSSYYGLNADSGSDQNDLTAIAMTADVQGAFDRWYGTAGGPNVGGPTRGTNGLKGDFGTTGSAGQINVRTGLLVTGINPASDAVPNGWSPSGPYAYDTRTSGVNTVGLGRPGDSSGDVGQYLGSIFVQWNGVASEQLVTVQPNATSFMAIYSNSNGTSTTATALIGAQAVFAPGTVNFTAVPEPASMALLGLGGLLLFRRPRRA